MICGYAGVDTHKDFHVLALLDQNLKVVGTWEFDASEEGYVALADRIGSLSVPVGIEGCGCYGAALAAHLKAMGFEVTEMIRPKRSQRRCGKSDSIDAIAAARNLAAGDGVPAKDEDGSVRELRSLMAVRERLVHHAVELYNCLEGILIRDITGMRERLMPLTGAARMQEATRACKAAGDREAILILAKEWIRATNEAEQLKDSIAAIVERLHPALLGAPGVGALSAARLVLAVGSNPKGVHSEAAFSMMCATSPIPASSGKTCRHRLNRGGNRQANRAIHDILISRMSHDERTRNYISKRISEGKTKREAMRCLKRYIAREIYGLLTHASEGHPNPDELKARRLKCGLTQKRIAESMEVAPRMVSAAENRVTYETTFLLAYERALDEFEKNLKTT